MKYVISILLIATGYAIRVIAIRSMKGSFTLYLTTPKNLCKTGLYRIVRHPSYVGSLLMFLGISMMSCIAAIMYLAFVFYVARIAEEERLLEYVFKEEYLEYKKKTGMLLPKLRSLIKWL